MWPLLAANQTRKHCRTYPSKSAEEKKIEGGRRGKEMQRVRVNGPRAEPMQPLHWSDSGGALIGCEAGQSSHSASSGT